MRKAVKRGLFGLLMILLGMIFACKKAVRQTEGEIRYYPIKPVPLTVVQIEDDFWRPRLETNRRVTIPFLIKMNEETGRVDNFAIAAGRKKGKYKGRRFNDTDVYKVIEGAAYSLQIHPDLELEGYIDSLVELIVAAQEEDGYLYPARTAHPDNPAPGAGPERWSRLKGSHELYNAGHMYEAAVAYYQATGKRVLLDAAIKNADLLVKTFGPEKRHDVPGHQEIEIGLAKLYLAVGNEKYLELAKFFLDERGRPHESGFYPEDSPFALYNGRQYMQDHLPVLEQKEAVGHAVRATYMYSGMADVATLTGNNDYVKALGRLWENVVSKKMYITGGIGARHTSESFGKDYELPNLSAYTETCAAIGNAFWNHRMFLLSGEAKYIDVMERIIYNGLLSAISLRGDRFFYQNPLESEGGYGRSSWFEVACCPGNIVRFIPSFPGYVYAHTEDSFYVNLFVQSEVEVRLRNQTIRLKQETRYPWNGAVRITVKPEYEAKFTIFVRIPGWAQNQPVPSELYRFKEIRDERVIIRINRKPAELSMDKGFAFVSREWKKGDVIELDFPLPVRRVLSHDSVKHNHRKVALQRGPIVYCLEEADNNSGVLNFSLPDDIALETEFRPELLGGVMIIKGRAVEAIKSKDGEVVEWKDREFTAIPYYAWAHRGEGRMAVWIPGQFGMNISLDNHRNNFLNLNVNNHYVERGASQQ